MVEILLVPPASTYDFKKFVFAKWLVVTKEYLIMHFCAIWSFLNICSVEKKLNTSPQVGQYQASKLVCTRMDVKVWYTFGIAHGTNLN